MNSKNCVAEIQLCAADDVLSKAERIGEMAAALAEMAGSKLWRICRDQSPDVPEEANCGREYPQYFGQMVDRLKRIEYELRSLEDIITRCEV